MIHVYYLKKIIEKWIKEKKLLKNDVWTFIKKLISYGCIKKKKVFIAKINKY